MTMRESGSINKLSSNTMSAACEEKQENAMKQRSLNEALLMLMAHYLGEQEEELKRNLWRSRSYGAKNDIRKKKMAMYQENLSCLWLSRQRNMKTSVRKM